MSEDGSLMLRIAAILILFGLNIIFYGFGAAVQELNESVLEKACLAGDKKAKRVYAIYEHPEGFVGTLKLIVMLSDLLLGMFLFSVFPNKFVALAAFLFVFLTFGVSTPKRLARFHSEQWAFKLINIVYATILLLKPLTILISFSSDMFLRLRGLDPKASNLDVTEEEIISIVNEGQEQGVLEKSEAEMITNIMEFGEKQANDIMTHRKSIVAVEIHNTLAEAASIMLKEMNSRCPVYDGDIDNIVGILHIKDVMRLYKEALQKERPISEIEGLFTKAQFVLQNKNIDELFKLMQTEKTHMVIVVDEYGQTAGLVTMEDVLEEIVGNIFDEYDEEEVHIKENADSTYIMEGLTPLEEAEEQLGITFEGDFETLNGFLVERYGKIPEKGDRFETDYKGYCFEIMTVENKVISKVLVTKLPVDIKKVDENDKK